MPFISSVRGSFGPQGRQSARAVSYLAIADILSNGLATHASAENLTIGQSYSSLTPLNNGYMGGTYISRVGAGGSMPYDTGTSGSVPVVAWGNGKAFDQRGSYAWRSTEDVGIIGKAPSTIVLIGEVNSPSGVANTSGYHIALNFGVNGANNTRAIASTGSVARNVWYSNDTAMTISAAVGVKNVYILRNQSGNNNFRWDTKSQNESGTIAVLGGGTDYNTTGPSKLFTQWRDDSGTLYPYGYIAEWMVFNRYLSDSEVTRIIDYGKTKYNFT
jgi:hypothetical protein